MGLALGVFLVASMVLWRRGKDPARVHPHEHPLIWFGFQVVEVLFLVALLFWLPDPGEWPEAARVSVSVLAVLALIAGNDALRRRFIPRKRRGRRTAEATIAPWTSSSR
jgi:drug/metabolite transporter (DMT)-like permease